MRRAPRGAALAVLLLVACAAFQVACRSTSAVPSKAPEVAIGEEHAGDPLVVEEHAPTAFDAIDGNQAVVVLLDASALRQGELFKTWSVLTRALPGFAESLDELVTECGFDPIHALTRAALSANVRGARLDEGTALIAFEADQPPAAVFSCVKNLAGAVEVESTRVRSYPALERGDGYLVAKDQVFLLGERSSVERAIRRHRGGARLPPNVYLYMTARVDNPLGVERAEFSLGEGAQRLHMNLSADTDTPMAAQRLAASAEQGRELLGSMLGHLDLEQAQQSFLERQLAQLRIGQNGSHASATLEIEGRDAVSALTGMAAALGVYGVRRYVAKAKTAGAHGHVMEIALRLRHYAEGAGQGRLPKSAPLTPAEVPRGVKVQAENAAWQHPSWKAVGFSIEGPQYFAYEFVTAKDRKSAVVRARADLDGNGAVTVVESTVTVHKDGTTSSTSSAVSSAAKGIESPVPP